MNMSGFQKTTHKKKDFDESVQGLGTSCHSLCILTLYAYRCQDCFVSSLFLGLEVRGRGGWGKRERGRARERARERRQGVRKTETEPTEIQDCVVCHTEDPRDQRLPASF